jgi:hypothetical protein
MRRLIFMVVIIASSKVIAATGQTSLAKLTDEQIVQQIDFLTESRDLKGIESLAASLNEELAGSDPSRLGHLALRICNELGTFDFRDNRRYGVASEIAMKTLKLEAQMPQDVAAGLAMRLRAAQDSNGPVPAAPEASLRQEQAGFWFSVYKRILTAATTQPDPNFRASIDGAPAGFDDIAPGSDPSAIQDPKRRAQYSEALASYRASSHAYFEHEQALRLIDEYRAGMIKYLQNAYPNESDLKALDNAMETAGIKPSEADRIRHAVGNRPSSSGN